MAGIESEAYRCRSSLAPAVTRRPRRFCFRGMPGLLIALHFRVASRRRASHSGVRPLLTGPDRPPAFCGRFRRLQSDEPDEQLAPRQSGDDPGILPVGPDPVRWAEPGIPLPREARGAARGAQAVSTP
jgi:hypothetical protein